MREFGEKGFDYAGNDRCDLAVWSSARKAILVNPDSAGEFTYCKSGPSRPGLRGSEERIQSTHLKPLRPQHWLKNLLVFVPLVAAHRLFETDLLGKVLLAFLAFGCFASAGYLLNDLLDLPEDRHHPNKRFRLFAAGDLPLSYGLAMIPALLGLGCLIGMMVSRLFLLRIVDLPRIEPDLLPLPEEGCSSGRDRPCRSLHDADHGGFRGYCHLAVALVIGIFNVFVL